MYDQRWAWTVLEQARDQLRDDYARGGRGDLFGALEPLLSSDAGGRSRAELASELGIGLGALDVAVHRLRRRYGECIRAIIAETVSDPEEVDAEIRHLRSVLCR
jgi:RNA polymerase sigma-70 factor (ECF subfamily)